MHPCESHFVLRLFNTFSTLKSTNNCAVTSTHHLLPPLPPFFSMYRIAPAANPSHRHKCWMMYKDTLFFSSRSPPTRGVNDKSDIRESSDSELTRSGVCDWKLASRSIKCSVGELSTSAAFSGG